MCKLMAFSDGSRIKNLKLVINRALPLITKHDQHGFGWSAQGERGAFGERMTELAHGFRLDANKYAVGRFPIAETYNAFGTESAVQGGLLIHARTSTNHKTLINTHPIQRNDWTLVHNGVVSNRGLPYKMNTTNDTEHLVHYLSTDGIKAIETQLSGYYAFAAFDPQGFLHICRDDNATLHVAWIRSIKSYIFATTRDLIEDLCTEMKWKRGPIDAVSDNVYMVLQGNEILKQQTIKPRGYDRIEEAKMQDSLHYLNRKPTWETSRFETPAKRNASESVAFDMDTMLDVETKPSASTLPGEIDLVAAEYGFNPEVVDLFLSEVTHADGRIFTEDNTQIDLFDFEALSLVEKLACVVYLDDGTMLSIEAVERMLDADTVAS